MLFNNVDVVLGLYQDAAFLPRVSSISWQALSGVSADHAQLFSTHTAKQCAAVQ